MSVHDPEFAAAPKPFVFVPMPELHFGAGRLDKLPALVRRHGRRALLVSGSASFAASPFAAPLFDGFAAAGVELERVTVSGEPSPEFVDDTVARYRAAGIDCVIGLGGGSAVDAGKAISAMLTQEAPVSDFLEGVGHRQHDGRKLPYIAVPTTSGTGAEATKNAVISSIGPDGFKNSLRHDRFVPDLALIDPRLMLACPPEVTAACALDALTQLLESYVSTAASPLTDALAESGLAHVAAGFRRAVENGAEDLAARGHLAYAAFLSGVTLANAGLGLVHGFAGPIGGFHPIPHGVVCGTLLGATTRATIDALNADVVANRTALAKYARAGEILAQSDANSLKAGCARLVETLDDWVERTRMPRLGAYGIGIADLPRILDKSNGKNSPAKLGREAMAAILHERL